MPKRAAPRVPIERVRSGEPVRVSHPPFDVVLVALEVGVFALEDACNHAGASLAEGEVEGACIRCPQHGYRFDLRTGALVEPRGLCDAQRVFAVRIEGGDYVIETDG